MLSTIEAINSAVNNFIWGVPAMICIIGVGLVLSFRTRFLQIRKFPYAMKVTFGRMFKKREASDGAMTPFQAVCTALAATVGTGNIAGVAGAIAIGGPGAVFWMWISAILGMCTKFSEVTLAVHFREKMCMGIWSAVRCIILRTDSKSTGTGWRICFRVWRTDRIRNRECHTGKYDYHSHQYGINELPCHFKRCGADC